MRVLLILNTIFFAFLNAGWEPMYGPPCVMVHGMSIGTISTGPCVYIAFDGSRLYSSTNQGQQWDSLHAEDATKHCFDVVTRYDDANHVFIIRNTSVVSQNVAYSTDQGATWDYRAGGIDHPTLSCITMARAPNQDILFIGASGFAPFNSLFKTTSNGINWEGKGFIGFNVTSICINPINPDIVMVATSTGQSPDDGLYRSINGGETWTRVQEGHFLSVIFANSAVAYASHTDFGIYKSTDCGASWLLLSGSPPEEEILCLGTDPNSADIVYAGARSVMHNFYKTTDGGTTWIPKEQGMIKTAIGKIVINPINPNQLWAGCHRVLYISNDAGETWQEQNKGFVGAPSYGYDVRSGYHCYITKDRFLRSINSGSDWETVYDVFSYIPPLYEQDFDAASMDAKITSDLSRFYATIGYTLFTRGGRIMRSVDLGKSWEKVWEYTQIGGSALLTCITPHPFDNQIAYAGFWACPGFNYSVIKTIDGGSNWFGVGNFPGTKPWTSALVVDKQATNTLYLGNNRTGITLPGVFKSTDAGANWFESGNGLPTGCVNSLAIDPFNGNKLYAGTENSVYKSTDAGQNWFYRGSGIGDQWIVAHGIDPEEPSILYASTYDYIYLTVDGGARWIDITTGFLEYRWPNDFAIDPDYPDKTYAGAMGRLNEYWPGGLYSYMPPFKKSLVSSSDTATSYNNSRKMIRVENTDEIWITYESGEVIYAVQSLNAGSSWSRKMEVGEGCHPAISLNPGDNLPCLVWRGRNGQSIYYSRYDGTGWTSPFVIFEEINFTIGPPSFTIDNIGYGHIIFNTDEPTDQILYGVFNIYEPWPIFPTVLDSGEPCGLASIDFMLDFNSLHATWAKQGAVYYNFCDAGGWHNIEQVSGFEGGSYPSLQTNGSCANITYAGFGAGDNPDIYFRYTYHYDGSHWWSEIWNVSNTMDVSLYPTLSGLNITWTEGLGVNSEIFLSRFDPVSGGWRPPVNISTSNEKSIYSHMVRKQTLTETRYYLTWTEKNQAPYDIKFRLCTLPIEPDEPLYVADAGKENPGPFNLKRTGFNKYGKESYKTVDYDNDYLYYKMGKFNPRRLYKVEGVFYHENSQNSELIVEIDGKGIGRITVPPKAMKRLKAPIPVELYQDSIIYAKVKSLSGNAVLGVLIVCEYEESKAGAGGGRGAQSVESNLLVPKDFAISNSPNPFQKMTIIRYQLPVHCKVLIEIYDACGKLIKRLTAGERKAGYYSLTWNGRDEKGKSLASGIYFCKIKANNFNQTKKLLLLK